MSEAKKSYSRVFDKSQKIPDAKEEYNHALNEIRTLASEYIFEKIWLNHTAYEFTTQNPEKYLEGYTIGNPSSEQEASAIFERITAENHGDTWYAEVGCSNNPWKVIAVPTKKYQQYFEQVFEEQLIKRYSSNKK